MPKDAWGNPFVFTCPGELTSVDIVSLGEDGELGTDDDISNAAVEEDDVAKTDRD